MLLLLFLLYEHTITQFPLNQTQIPNYIIIIIIIIIVILTFCGVATGHRNVKLKR
jgi:hypothetical protein